MSSEHIHIYKEGWRAHLRLVLFMLPGVVFILVLLLFLSFSSYQTQKAANSANPVQVLGTNR
ncbi:hypothetical protein A2803_05900 [Candidatus Woesebacteria bacterium RIFCSPHIGHO2_01_FULL_44_21]|uniref:Uncharacterized protein n=1 Tax=Candidatus Woesebacteria bacterium RIFCSPHIGHO2_01_FULL_44_21 TaxID=1802503 RepID=A0A1F7Z165_9BACT|nr:MAG: hypothetical protein A2803_05900 [Candidatus Woesebacteria bacterium RIFCSPHIGHO2_01_FULL_44_21]OGM71086.1 MAG: hypothetical protein A2897_02525 [Candidatus Woesebacteria bacterium RIFCSPLOWO2_01_FULL_44_24b]